jgi:hypothetical protein
MKHQKKLYTRLIILTIFLILVVSFLIYYFRRKRVTKDQFIGHDGGGLNISSAIRGYNQNQQPYYRYWIPGYNNTTIYKDWIYNNKLCKNVNTVDDIIICIPEVKDWPVDSYKWRELRPVY